MNQRPPLPQSVGGVYLTDGGIETDLIFHRGFDLPLFPSFVLHDDAESEDAVREYFRDYLQIGASLGYGLVLETLAWRASSEWGEQLGYDASRLRDVNERAVRFLLDLRDSEADSVVVVSGCVGPRVDAYSDPGSMGADEAQRYHRPQVEILAQSGVDLVSALTITNSSEAISIAQAAKDCGIPVVISFTVETDGTLPTGMELADAIASVDSATGEAPSYYMINCAHPDHFESVLERDDERLARVRGVRANASRKSHAELDESEDLDDGDPAEWGAHLARLNSLFPRINVLGGCCGTDHRHVKELALAARTN